MAKRTISGIEFTSRRYAKRDHWTTRVAEGEVELAHVEKDSCGSPLGWYFTVYGPKFHVAGEDSRTTDTWFDTPEAAFAAALVMCD